MLFNSLKVMVAIPLKLVLLKIFLGVVFYMQIIFKLRVLIIYSYLRFADETYIFIIFNGY